jgi:hypothetical protein
VIAHVAFAQVVDRIAEAAGPHPVAVAVKPGMQV